MTVIRHHVGGSGGNQIYNDRQRTDTVVLHKKQD